MQGNRQFNDTEIWAQMPSGLGKDADQFFPHLLCELGQFLFAQRLDIGGRSNPVEQARWRAVVSEVRDDSEEFDFIICAFGFIYGFGRSSRFRRGLEILNYRLSCAVASYDFDLLFGLGKSFLANFHQIHSLFVTHDEIFEREFAGFHLLDNFFEPVHRAFKVKLCLARLRFAAHGENGGIKHSLAQEKRTTYAETPARNRANRTL